jgi:hypothetical protein
MKKAQPDRKYVLSIAENVLPGATRERRREKGEAATARSGRGCV